MTEELLRAVDVVKHFPIVKQRVIGSKISTWVHACDGINLKIRTGETVGLVGESGCGKTTFARVILCLVEPTSGKVYFRDLDLFEAFQSRDRHRILQLRRKMQLVFQNPYGSLNPRWTVEDIISEPYGIHKHVPREEWRERVTRLLSLVGLEDYHAERYPHEFSGGQRQRICIARALAVEPEFIIWDEPVSSLDVSIRAQILNLMKELQKKFGLTYLYISHDLASVRYISDTLMVMYLGIIAEHGSSDEIFDSPLHPYTVALLSAIPVPDPATKVQRIILPGEVPSPINPPSGCRFHPRCPKAMPICRGTEPEMREVTKNHFVACHLYG